MRHAINLSLNSNSEAMINCNETEISQVIVNLLSNAIDATKTMRKKWVKVSIVEEGGEVVLKF